MGEHLVFSRKEKRPAATKFAGQNSGVSQEQSQTISVNLEGRTESNQTSNRAAGGTTDQPREQKADTKHFSSTRRTELSVTNQNTKRRHRPNANSTLIHTHRLNESSPLLYLQPATNWSFVPTGSGNSQPSMLHCVKWTLGPPGPRFSVLELRLNSRSASLAWTLEPPEELDRKTEEEPNHQASLHPKTTTEQSVLPSTKGNHQASHKHKKRLADPDNSREPPMIRVPQVPLNRLSISKQPSATLDTVNSPALAAKGAELVGRWLVQLRRFGSADWHMVQVSALDWRRWLLNQTRQNTTSKRRIIAFTGLEAGAGYQLCLEPLGADQQYQQHQNQSQEVQTKWTQPMAQLSDQNQILDGPSSCQQWSDSSAAPSGLQRLCKEFVTPISGILTFGPSLSSRSSWTSESGPPVAAGRKPKSLGSGSQNKLQLLEINESTGGQQDEGRTIASEQLLFQVQLPPDASSLSLDSTAKTTTSLSNESSAGYLSALPIVGCVLALILMATLANVLLGALNCRGSRPVHTKRTRRGWFTGSVRNRKLAQSGELMGSQSRILVGNNYSRSELFASSGAHFECISQPSNKHPMGHFQLCSSFEDRQADMVGLARKNYDNFIHNIYNARPLQCHSPTSGSPCCCNASPDSSASSSQVGGPSQHRPSSAPHALLWHQRKTARGRTAAHDASKQVSPPQQTSPGQNRLPDYQRIRFDKINPIYNMDSLLTVCTPCNTSDPVVAPTSSLGRIGARTHLTSFGQPHKQTPSVIFQAEKQHDCPLCPTADETLVSKENQEAPYTCCLDRQKQRMERQQQQLERVLSKNGSLLPQPFIHPPPPGCGSLLGQKTTVRSSEMDNQTYHHSIDESLGSQQQLERAAEELQLGQRLTKSQEEVDGQHEMKQKYIMFGQTSTDSSLQNDNQDLSSHKSPNKDELKAPVSPKPEENAQISSVAPINKSDFNQRRNELASKLNLAGMAKQAFPI